MDTGHVKKAYGYLKIINDFKKIIPEYIKINEISIYIASYSEKRAKILENDFITTQEEKKKALKVMSEYENKYSLNRANRNFWSYQPPAHYLNAEKIFYNTPSINKQGSFKITWKLEKYKKNLSLSENYIKESDKAIVNELKKKFVVIYLCPSKSMRSVTR